MAYTFLLCPFCLCITLHNQSISFSYQNTMLLFIKRFLISLWECTVLRPCSVRPSVRPCVHTFTFSTNSNSRQTPPLRSFLILSHAHTSTTTTTYFWFTNIDAMRCYLSNIRNKLQFNAMLCFEYSKYSCDAIMRCYVSNIRMFWT
jgi:hypothetical protein